MRRASLLVIALVLFAGSACSGDDSGDDDRGARGPDPVENAPEVLPGEDALRPGLLTIDDFPSGWAALPEGDEDEDPLCGAFVADVLGLDRDKLPSATVQFAEDRELGPLFGESIGFVPEGKGSKALNGIAAKIDNCEDEVDGRPTRATRLSYPSVGDESVGFRVTIGDEDDTQVVFDVIYARVGDLLVGMFAVDVFGDATEVLDTFVEPAIERARTIA